MDWVTALGLFGVLIAVSASQAWWLTLAPVGLIDLVAVISWISAVRRPELKPWEDPLPDFGPLLWAELAMTVTLGAAMGWTIRLLRTGQRRRAAMMLIGVAVPVVGISTVAAA